MPKYEYDITSYQNGSDKLIVGMDLLVSQTSSATEVHRLVRDESSRLTIHSGSRRQSKIA